MHITAAHEILETKENIAQNKNNQKWEYKVRWTHRNCGCDARKMKNAVIMWQNQFKRSDDNNILHDKMTEGTNKQANLKKKKKNPTWRHIGKKNGIQSSFKC